MKYNGYIFLNRLISLAKNAKNQTLYTGDVPKCIHYVTLLIGMIGMSADWYEAHWEEMEPVIESKRKCPSSLQSQTKPHHT